MTTDAWTRVNGVGLVVYDDQTVDFDDTLICFDGGDGNDWAPISKPLT